ncbi:cysteine hydrolase [Caulobacter sp. KR2-114]|uniref:cysteine hydrolase n=1 Tax=Caulobacter sp. KR2-114 TaxID=3400912 RepID=UPI003BFBC3EE
MARYPPQRTGVLLINPHNEFLSEGGVYWDALAPVAHDVGLLINLAALLQGARRAGVQIFHCPHHRFHEGDFDTWLHPTPAQLRIQRTGALTAGSWGGEWRAEFAPVTGDTVCADHWGHSSFANTDLDFQLKQRAVDRVIVVGVDANSAIETTGRYAVELGYHVTLVTDATAAETWAAMTAAHQINGPTYAHAILDTDAVLKAMAAG